MKKINKDILDFVKKFNFISSMGSEEIMEWLNDNNYLSDSGKIFRNRFWDLFIKKKNGLF